MNRVLIRYGRVKSAVEDAVMVRVWTLLLHHGHTVVFRGFFLAATTALLGANVWMTALGSFQSLRLADVMTGFLFARVLQQITEVRDAVRVQRSYREARRRDAERLGREAERS